MTTTAVEDDTAELRRRAIKYYEENGIPAVVESVLNAMFYEDPEDPYGYMGNHFLNYSPPPTILKVGARITIDSRILPALQVDLYCRLKNKNCVVSSVVLMYPQPRFDFAKPDVVEEHRGRIHGTVEMAVEMIHNQISNDIVGMAVVDQADIDAKIGAYFETDAAVTGGANSPSSPSRLEPVFDISSSVVVDSDEPVVSQTPNLNNSAREETQIPRLFSQSKDFCLESLSSASNINNSGLSAKKKSRSKSVRKSPCDSRRSKKGHRMSVGLEEEEELFPIGSMCVCAVSLLMCKGAAFCRDELLYSYVGSLGNVQAPEKYRVPQIAVTILQNESTARLRCVREFLIIPRFDMPLSMSVHHIADISYCIIKTTKAGARSSHGPALMNVDKAEQGLELIISAIRSIGLVPAVDFHIGIVASPSRSYSNGKYETVAGSPGKTASEMVVYWTELIKKYPSVVMIIDPFRSEDAEVWSKLATNLSSSCYVMGDRVLPRISTWSNERMDLFTNGAVLHIDPLTTVTDLIELVRRIHDSGKELMLRTSPYETLDTTITDIAVGSGVRFLQLSLTPGEQSMQLNYLLHLEAYFDLTNNYIKHEPYNHRPLPKSPSDAELCGGGRKKTASPNHLSPTIQTS